MQLSQLVLIPALLLPALAGAAAFDFKGLALGANEKEIRRVLPSAHCKALEWQSKAADRRCDDTHVVFGGIDVRVTFYLRKDAIEAFDVRFDTKDLASLVAFLKGRYGAPQSEDRETLERKGQKPRQIYKVLWEAASQRAALVAQLNQRNASMLVSRGDFEEEIYRVR